MKPTIYLLESPGSGHDITADPWPPISRRAGIAQQRGFCLDALQRSVQLRDWDSVRAATDITVTSDPDLSALPTDLWFRWASAHFESCGQWVVGPVTITPRPGTEIEPERLSADITDSVTGRTITLDFTTWDQVRDYVARRLRLHERVAEIHEIDQWSELRRAQAEVDRIEGLLATARAARNKIMHRHIDRGATRYELAKITGLSQPSIARIVGQAQERNSGAS